MNHSPPDLTHLDLLLVGSLVLHAASVGAARPGPGLLPVGLHHAAQVGGLVGHVLLQEGESLVQIRDTVSPVLPNLILGTV